MKIFSQPSVMNAQQHFSQVPSADIPRSKFNRSHKLLTTFDAGLLIPVFLDEVLPGDTIDLNHTAFARLATPLKPVMDNIFLDTHYFFVPTRLIWDNWQRFMGERLNPNDTEEFTIPTTAIDLATNDANTLPSYFGLPRRPGAVSAVDVSALPFRAYMLIWNEWYRDQNLQDPIDVPTDDGPDTWDNSLPLRRGKRHDYFTSCLPWPQKGDPVLLPLGGTAPVYATNDLRVALTQTGWPSPGNNLDNLRMQTTGELYSNTPSTPGTNTATIEGDVAASDINDVDFYADLATASAVTINDLRTAFQIQKLLERDARGGTRYIEIILNHFGVRSDDARLQRPEYLGGSTSSINIDPVAATVAIPTVPQGGLAGVGTSVNRAGANKSFTEHGFVIGLVSARADLTYQQGIDRMWTRQTKYDFYWPALAHLGEQAVLNQEIFAQGDPAIDTDVFGYQERWAEYRYKPSRITGIFNSDQPSSLDVWHLAQDFANLPLLNAAFIEDNPPIDRVIAVPSEPHFLLDMWFDYEHTRPLPVYSVPGLVDHF